MLQTRPFKDYKGFRLYARDRLGRQWSSIYTVTPRCWRGSTNEFIGVKEFHKWVDQEKRIDIKVRISCGRGRP